MVWMNDHLVARSAPQVPWGGVKGSGIGRARGAVALRTCAEPKVVTWDPPIGRPAWWFPYDETLERAARAVLGLRSARDSDRERAVKHGGAALRTAGRALGPDAAQRPLGRTVRSGTGPGARRRAVPHLTSSEKRPPGTALASACMRAASSPLKSSARGCVSSTARTFGLEMSHTRRPAPSTIAPIWT